MDILKLFSYSFHGHLDSSILTLVHGWTFVNFILTLFSFSEMVNVLEMVVFLVRWCLFFYIMLGFVLEKCVCVCVF